MRQLPFFNVLNTLSDMLITTVYNKSTFTGVLKNYNYFLWFTYTNDLIKALIDRSFCLNSKCDGFHLNLESIRIILQKRLPFKLIDKSVKKYLIKYNNPNIHIDTFRKCWSSTSWCFSPVSIHK